MMQTEPIYVHHAHQIGDLPIEFIGEKWDGVIGDTMVTINGDYLCSIGWDDKDKFLHELQYTIEKYRI